MNASLLMFLAYASLQNHRVGLIINREKRCLSPHAPLWEEEEEEEEEEEGLSLFSVHASIIRS